MPKPEARFQTTGGIVTVEEPDFRAFKRYLDNLNSRDPERVPDMFTPKVIFEDSAWLTVMHGPDEIKEMLVSRWNAFPDLHFRVIEGPYATDDTSHMAVKMRLTGTMSGGLAPPGFDPTDGKVELDVASFYDFADDDRVKRGRVIFDTAYLAQQIGAMPSPNSLAMQADVVFQKVTAWWMRNRGPSLGGRLR
ncbi:MAG TPA: ester cyclase [Thermoleophilaceae bacterium]